MVTQNSKQPLTVVLAVFTLQGNGAERFVLTLAKGLTELGHKAHVVCFKPLVDLPVPPGVQLHVFNYKLYRALPRFCRSFFAAKGFDWFVKKHIGMPDLVLSNLFQVDFVLAKSALPNVHFVIHNTMSEEYAGRLSPKTVQALRSLYQSKPCVAVSQGVEQDFKSLFGSSSQISTIYNPIDMQLVESQASAFKPEHENYIVHVGKFKAQKRHDLLIRAFAESGLDCSLLLVGSGPLMEQNKELARQLGVADQVVFVGFCSNPYPFLKHAQLMAVSSDFEGFSIAILEALALGVPVVSTDCPSGPREVLQAHQLCPVDSVSELAQKLVEAWHAPQHFIQPLDNQFKVAHAAQRYIELTKKTS